MKGKEILMTVLEDTLEVEERNWREERSWRH